MAEEECCFRSLFKVYPPEKLMKHKYWYGNFIYKIIIKWYKTHLVCVCVNDDGGGDLYIQNIDRQEISSKWIRHM